MITKAIFKNENDFINHWEQYLKYLKFGTV